jgi:MoaA/NifB/PqqE/SkfB family radical SAM enzyme
MELEKIGFYTLSDARCKHASESSPIYRAEIILTSRCNFHCVYCRGLRKDIRGEYSLEDAEGTIELLSKERLKNIRFSGGEPTAHPNLVQLVRKAKSCGVERIAVSTNGSAPFEHYSKLVDAGVNDFSVSLDSCCAATADGICGVSGAWKTVTENIGKLSGLTYVTVGVVLTEQNAKECAETVKFASELGVSDIRVIPAAQYSPTLNLPNFNFDRYPILNYRIQNHKIRGLCETDNKRCPLVLDDVAIAGGKHFPCIIYMREGGDHIGTVGPNMRNERKVWFESHDCHDDKICNGTCLDVCREYNNRWLQLRDYKTLPKMDSSLFDSSSWRLGADFLSTFGFHLRWNGVKNSKAVRDTIRKAAVGWARGEDVPCRPKSNETAVMFATNNGEGWCHLRNSEMFEVFGGIR